MAKLTWAKKLNNRLKRNWNITIDTDKCGTTKIVGKREDLTDGSFTVVSDETWEKIYRMLRHVNKHHQITLEYSSQIVWDEDYEQQKVNESEYYGIRHSIVKIIVKTPTGRLKSVIYSNNV